MPQAYALQFKDENETTEITEIVRQSFPINSTEYRYSVCGAANETNINQFFSGSIVNSLTPESATILENSCFNSTLVLNVNNYAEGEHTFSVSAVSPIETKQLSIKLIILGSNVWNIINNSRGIELSENQFTSFTLHIENTGDIALTLLGQLENIDNIAFVDLSDFHIPARSSVKKPVYLQTFNTTPGLKVINITARDELNTIKKLFINLLIHDETPPNIINFSITPSVADISQEIEIRLQVSDNSKILNVTLIDSDKNITIPIPFFADDIYRLLFRENEIAGERRAVIRVVDESNNSQERSIEFVIKPLKALKIDNEVDLGKVRFLEVRNIVVGETFVPIFLGIKLNNFQALNNQNASFDIFVNDKLINVSETQFFNNHVGSIILTVRQNPVYVYTSVVDSQQIKIYSPVPRENFTQSNDPLDYFTEYVGEIEIISEATVENKNPKISFKGEFNMYSVSKPLSLPVPFFDTASSRIKSTTFNCTSIDNDVYEDSMYRCEINFPVDIDSTDFSVIAPASSYSNLIDGYEKNLTFTSLERDSKGLWAIIFGLLFFFLVGGFLVNKFVWKNVLWL